MASEPALWSRIMLIVFDIALILWSFSEITHSQLLHKLLLDASSVPNLKLWWSCLETNETSDSFCKMQQI